MASKSLRKSEEQSTPAFDAQQVREEGEQISNAQLQEELAEGATYEPPGPLPPFFELLPTTEEHTALLAEEVQRTRPPSKDEDPVGGAGANPEGELDGIGTSVAISRFVSAAKEVQEDWGDLSADERAQQLGGAANSELEGVSVPACSISLGDLGHAAGQLQFTTWTLALGEEPFNRESVDEDQAASMADTVYHEARHAEQWHRMARYAAGLGKSADDLKREMFIPARIAADAVAKKYDISNDETAAAESWYESVYGTGAEERNEVLTNLGTLSDALSARGKECDEAQKYFESIKDDQEVSKEDKDAAYDAWVAAYEAWELAKKEHDENYQKYRALAEEADAWEVGGAVKAAYLA